VQVARSYVKLEIVWGWDPEARFAMDRRLWSFGNPPPVIGVGVRFVCCRLPEQLPETLENIVSSSVLNVFFILFYLSGIVLQW
jgi:hypothetical protein